jgi:hypothetical protein
MNSSQDPQSASVPDTHALAAQRSAGSFIVNLCALPTPAIPQPPPTELEALRSFVSRRTKDGIDRFYLHVGFFQTSEEAEEWLSTARTTYPNAFVSKLADTLRSAEPGAPPVADTQVLRVLEARAPQRGESGGDTGSYAVQSEARMLGTPPATAAVAWPMPAAPLQATPARPAAKPPANLPAKVDAKKAPLSAAEAWNVFVAEANSDSSPSGVRHLRVEIQRPRKSAKTRKR